MSELVPETEKTGKKAFRISYILIALLTLVCLLQAVALMGRNNARQKDLVLPLHKRDATLVRTYSQPSPASPLMTAWDSDPFEEFDAMSRRMSNLMRQAYIMSVPLIQSFHTMGGFDFTPAVDLEETADAYILRSDLPGLDKDKIGVTVRDNIVTLEGVRETSAESQDEKKGFYSQERSYGSFSRSLNLPGPVDESNI
ncbi:MAG: Hsp20/alpha crystallin family protein, partial [Candidatus Omnitrophica bacterium]|nr:Hsp20/alpha crystallin family protein [Candidatus Omnitrophota bacterium]